MPLKEFLVLYMILRKLCRSLHYPLPGGKVKFPGQDFPSEVLANCFDGQGPSFQLPPTKLTEKKIESEIS